MVDVPQEAATNLLSLFVRVSDQRSNLIAKMLWTGLEANLMGCVNVNLLQFCGQVHQCTEIYVGVLTLSSPDHAFRTATSREPHRRMWFLNG